MSPEELKHELLMLVDGSSPLLKSDFGNGFVHQYSRWEVDPEVGHSKADNFLVKTLRELGYGEAMDIYEAHTRWMA